MPSMQQKALSLRMPFREISPTFSSSRLSHAMIWGTGGSGFRRFSNQQKPDYRDSQTGSPPHFVAKALGIPVIMVVTIMAANLSISFIALQVLQCLYGMMIMILSCYI